MHRYFLIKLNRNELHRSKTDFVVLAGEANSSCKTMTASGKNERREQAQRSR